MKIVIEYEKKSGENPCQASAKIDDRWVVSLGPSYAEAKTRLLRKIRHVATVPDPPPNEAVEL